MWRQNEIVEVGFLLVHLEFQILIISKSFCLLNLHLCSFTDTESHGLQSHIPHYCNIKGSELVLLSQNLWTWQNHGPKIYDLIKKFTFCVQPIFACSELLWKVWGQRKRHEDRRLKWIKAYTWEEKFLNQICTKEHVKQ